jgi:hypothetical protein
MRLTFATIGMMIVTTNGYAQTPCAPPIVTYDPYKPSHLAIMREYGGAALAHAPLSSLLALDPYVPSQGELLRQVGRGIPLWPPYHWYVPTAPARMADCNPVVEAVSPAAPPLTRFADVVALVEASPAATSPTSSREATRGVEVSIHYADRAWMSAGPAIPFRESEFARVGESRGLTVYQRGAADDVIYVPTTSGMVAPFRRSQ